MGKYEDAISEIEMSLPRREKYPILCGSLDLAIEALREAAEREEGCEYCASALAPLYKISTNGHPSFELFEPVFCPMCGRALTKEGNK